MNNEPSTDDQITMLWIVNFKILYMNIFHFCKLCQVESHRRWKGWGYRAAAPPHFKSALYRILIFTIENNIFFPVK